MINQALIALRDLLAPANTDTTGLVTGVSAGQYQVATRRGTRDYPAAPGLAPHVGQRVALRNGIVARVIGAGRAVPTYYV